MFLCDDDVMKYDRIRPNPDNWVRVILDEQYSKEILCIRVELHELYENP